LFQQKMRFSLTALAIIAVLSSSACRAPLLANRSEADFTLNFIMSGKNLESVTSSGAGSRLLLPTAATLTVTLTANDGSFDERTRTVSLAGTPAAGTVPVGFTEIPMGEYTVKADATDATGAVLFTQVSPLTVSETNASVTLNLVPASPAGLPTLTGETATFDLGARTSITYVVPIGSPFFAGTRGVITAAETDVYFYIQAMDGRTIESGPVATPGAANSLGADDDLYFTVYNDTIIALTGITYQVAHSVSYRPSAAIVGEAPIDATAYLAGSPVTIMSSIVANTGAPIRDGVTERLEWNTSPDGTGTAYAYGQAIVMGSANMTLYPKWTTTDSPSTDSVLGKIGPAGGVVFYDRGSVIDGWRYLEAAPTNQAYIHDDPSSIVPWSNVTDAMVTTTGTIIGTGKVNTAAMIGQSGYSSASPNAASVCDELSIITNGTTYDDWFLPSRDELQAIAVNVVALNMYGSGTYKMEWDYWSSTEVSSTEANGYYVNCYSPWGNTLNTRTKAMSLNVRAIRSF